MLVTYFLSKFNIIRVYDKYHPQVILETFGHKNPWVNHEDVLHSGVIILGESPEDVIWRAKETVILLPENESVLPVEYKYTIKNRVGKTKEFSLYYAVIKPMN